MKEQIEKRIDELEKLKNDHIANANYCIGAIAELKSLLVNAKPENQEGN